MLVWLFCWIKGVDARADEPRNSMSNINSYYRTVPKGFSGTQRASESESSRLADPMKIEEAMMKLTKNLG